MFKKIIENWCKRKEHKKYMRSFRNGYDYAAGELLRKEHTPISLESYFYGASMDNFDQGIRAAVQDAILQGLVKDDRL